MKNGWNSILDDGGYSVWWTYTYYCGINDDGLNGFTYQRDATSLDLNETITLFGGSTSGKYNQGLLDTGRFSEFVDNTLADYAIGGPTSNMWSIGWNKTNPGNTVTSYLTWLGSGGGHSAVAPISAYTSNDNGVWFPGGDEHNETTGYYVCDMVNNGYCYCTSHYYYSNNEWSDYGIRVTYESISGTDGERNLFSGHELRPIRRTLLDGTDVHAIWFGLLILIRLRHKRG